MSKAGFRTSPKKKRNYGPPRGSEPSTLRVTDVLGPKPNWASWKAYHAIAQTEPWKLDADATTTHGPAVLARQTIVKPSRPLSAEDKAAIKAAHGKLSRGTVDRDGYLAALDAIGAGIVASTRKAGA